MPKRKTYKCPECDQKFHRPQGLGSHLRTHANGHVVKEKPVEVVSRGLVSTIEEIDRRLAVLTEEHNRLWEVRQTLVAVVDGPVKD